ncbi:MAG: hypothetical protein N4A49_03155 [Marinifilaceae bacterium]|jgi:hypothetical protein|nr:hypothetical protein [Marinifilaceae bacterium]
MNHLVKFSIYSLLFLSISFLNISCDDDDDDDVELINQADRSFGTYDGKMYIYKGITDTKSLNDVGYSFSKDIKFEILKDEEEINTFYIKPEIDIDGKIKCSFVENVANGFGYNIDISSINVYDIINEEYVTVEIKGVDAHHAGETSYHGAFYDDENLVSFAYTARINDEDFVFIYRANLVEDEEAKEE